MNIVSLLLIYNLQSSLWSNQLNNLHLTMFSCSFVCLFSVSMHWILPKTSQQLKTFLGVTTFDFKLNLCFHFYQLKLLLRDVQKTETTKGKYGTLLWLEQLFHPRVKLVRWHPKLNFFSSTFVKYFAHNLSKMSYV